MTRLSITFVVLVMALPELVAQTADPLSSSAPFWPSVWPSVFANVLYTVGIIATFYLVKGLGRRRQLVNFFADEVAPETKITIFQSVFSTGSNETFVNHDEAKLSRRLESLFNNPLPILSEDNWFRETIQIAGSTCHITHKLECQYSSVFSGNCIVVGSPAFNPVAEAFERFLKPPVHFEMVDTDSGRVTLRVVALGGQRDNISANSAVIVRIRNGAAVCIYVAGPTATSTAGAMHFVLTDWLKLSNWKDHHEEFWCEIQVPHGRPELAVAIGGPHQITPSMKQLALESPRLPDYWSGCRRAKFAAYLQTQDAKITTGLGEIPRTEFPSLKTSAQFSGARDGALEYGNEISGSIPPR